MVLKVFLPKKYTVTIYTQTLQINKKKVFSKKSKTHRNFLKLFKI